MLRGISPRISPELLAALHSMGHGDELVLADAHYPGASQARLALRADGLRTDELLEAILPLLVIDTYVEDPLVTMAPAPGDALDPAVERSFRELLDRFQPGLPPLARLERRAFYERARGAFEIVVTGDVRKYANLIVAKGVTPVE